MCFQGRNSQFLLVTPTNKKNKSKAKSEQISDDVMDVDMCNCTGESPLFILHPFLKGISALSVFQLRRKHANDKH